MLDGVVHRNLMPGCSQPGTPGARIGSWGPSWGTVMRDIRDDLQERASLIEQEIAAAGIDFEKAVEQLQGKLRAELAALGVAMLAEHYKSFLIDSLGGDGRP
jgi:hypothetical protein